MVMKELRAILIRLIVYHIFIILNDSDLGLVRNNLLLSQYLLDPNLTDLPPYVFCLVMSILLVVSNLLISG